MDELESLFIDLIPKCDECGVYDTLLHEIVDTSGTVKSLHCDNCCDLTGPFSHIKLYGSGG